MNKYNNAVRQKKNLELIQSNINSDNKNGRNMNMIR